MKKFWHYFFIISPKHEKLTIILFNYMNYLFKSLIESDMFNFLILLKKNKVIIIDTTIIIENVIIRFITDIKELNIHYHQMMESILIKIGKQ